MGFPYWISERVSIQGYSKLKGSPDFVNFYSVMLNDNVDADLCPGY